MSVQKFEKLYNNIPYHQTNYYETILICYGLLVSYIPYSYQNKFRIKWTYYFLSVSDYIICFVHIIFENTCHIHIYDIEPEIHISFKCIITFHISTSTNIVCKRITNRHLICPDWTIFRLKILFSRNSVKKLMKPKTHVIL